MAEIKPDSPDYAQERAGVSTADLHKEMMSRHDECRDYWKSEYELARQDMEFAFLPDSQWDDWMTKTREGRPMYTVNKVRQSMKQITNDQRQNRPQAKVRAEEDGDVELAEVRQGLIRNIDSKLDAQRAVDTAFQFAVGGGFGVWRLTTSYQDDGGFDQVIQREEIANPYSVVWDPSSRKKDRRDARYAFVDAQWARSAFKARYPEARMVSVGQATDTNKGWWDEHEVTVSEYWYKKVETVEIVLMSDGSVYDVDDKFKQVSDDLALQGIREQRRRFHEREKVWHCIVSGAEILEGPNEWAGRFIPLVPVWGELLTLKDKERFFGAVRFAKDAQRMYNYERSTFIEVLADQPYSPFMADASSIEGYEGQYQSMRTKRPPVLLYNAQPNAPNGGKPSREAPPAFPAALANAAQISSDDIKAATGIYDASLGNRSNETSGKAIIARQREGDVANFDYIDNLAYALKYDFEVVNDLITSVYDTERQVRIIGEDGAEKVVRVNKRILDEQTGQPVTLNDMSQGRFDIAVTVGPSYTTQRMETAEAMQGLVQIPGPAGMIAQYAMFKALDAPGMEEAVKAYRRILVGQGLLEPADGEQAPPPPQPNPADITKAQLNEAQAGKYRAETEQTELENMGLATQLGVQAGMMGQPPLQPPGPMGPPMTEQPPQGGFFMPDAMGQPPQGTAPGGFPGQPN
jgi:hypothetical protein